MEKKEPLVIRFPSHIPSAYMVQFPPGQEYLTASTSKALSIIKEQPDHNEVYLVNPPEHVLKHLLDSTGKAKNITLFYDLLPKPEECSLIASFRVIVPSFGFYCFFSKHGVNVKLANLLASIKIEKTEEKEKAKENLLSNRDICLWIDERLIAPRYQTGIMQVISALLAKQSGLKVVWVSEKKRLPLYTGVHRLKPDDTDREKLWQNADMIITLGSVFQSFVPLHIQLLSKGIGVITDDRGDHSEWVNHLFTGFVLGRKETCKELGWYLFRLLKNPGLLQQFHRNGPLLTERVLQSKHETSTGQFNHSP